MAEMLSQLPQEVDVEALLMQALNRGAAPGRRPKAQGGAGGGGAADGNSQRPLGASSPGSAFTAPIGIKGVHPGGAELGMRSTIASMSDQS